MTENDNAAEAIPLRKRPIPDRLDYFAEKLAVQLDVDKLPRSAAITLAAAIINLGAIATEVRALLDERRTRATDEHSVLCQQLDNETNLREQLTAATARAEQAEARLAELGEPETQHRMVAPSGLIYPASDRDLADRDSWLDGVRLEQRTVYPTPWRDADDTAATDTGKAQQ